MGNLTSSEAAAVERAGAEPMLDQVLAWAAVNSGSRNLAGLERMAELLADAFAALPGVLRLENPQPVENVEPNGQVKVPPVLDLAALAARLDRSTTPTIAESIAAPAWPVAAVEALHPSCTISTVSPTPASTESSASTE